MLYRFLPRGGEKISVIGLGASSLHEAGKAAVKVVETALDAGVNCIDLAAAERASIEAVAAALKGRRGDALLQMHFGALYDGPTYAWTRDLDAIRRTFAWETETLGLEYADFGFLHCVDEPEDAEAVVSDGLLDYLRSLKAEGRVRHIGLSTHDPAIARRLLACGEIDLLMFSINPAYDYQKGEYGIGAVEKRASLYRDCQRHGVGISAMKPFAGGQLLNAALSPFGQALTPYQCLQYALDRPGVVTVLPGVRGLDDLEQVLAFLNAPPETRDYAAISQFAPVSAKGRCVYCNHCMPCPTSLNIGLINKLYDLACAGDKLAEEHYASLHLHAGDCLHCGHCERRCPFHVKQMERMEEIAAHFGF